MMNDQDCEDYNNIGRKIPFKEKFQYVTGKQITDIDTGKRVYEISNYRLPSVTTILGATKNTDFLKKWKAKVGEVEAERIKNHSSIGGHLCTSSSNLMWKELGTMILQGSDKRRVPWPTKLLRRVYQMLRNITARKSHCFILGCTLGALISSVITMVWRLL